MIPSCSSEMFLRRPGTATPILTLHRQTMLSTISIKADRTGDRDCAGLFLVFCFFVAIEDPVRVKPFDLTPTSAVDLVSDRWEDSVTALRRSA